jgi:GIY-YIG catalytic domain
MIQALKIIGTGLLSKVHWHLLGKRSFSCSATNWTPVKVYKNADIQEQILSENKGFSGIYKFTNKINGKIYVGSAEDLRIRFKRYFNRNYLKTNNRLISRALLKHGYSNFSL